MQSNVLGWKTFFCLKSYFGYFHIPYMSLNHLKSYCNEHIKNMYFFIMILSGLILFILFIYPYSLGLLHWCKGPWSLTHWGQVTNICISRLTIIGSDNGLSPDRYQAIIWTSAGIFLIIILLTNFSEIWSQNHTFWFKKMHLKMLSRKFRPSCLILNMSRVNMSRLYVHY